MTIKTVMRLTENGMGNLRADTLADLLTRVPGWADIEITQTDPDDYRNAGSVRWYFTATWVPEQPTDNEDLFVPLPRAYHGCTCSCHSSHSTKHAAACCVPSFGGFLR